MSRRMVNLTESSEPSTTPPEATTLSEHLHAAIQEALNKYADDDPTFLGDWILVLEGHCGEGQHLRIIDSDLSFWRKFGLVRFLDAQTQAEMTANMAYNAVLNGQDWDDDGEGSNA